MSNANHKVVVEAVHEMAIKERRSVANMAAVLLTEALCERKCQEDEMATDGQSKKGTT